MSHLKIKDNKEIKCIRIKKSLNNKLLQTSKAHNLKQIDIITNGIEMYLKYLNEK